MAQASKAKRRERRLRRQVSLYRQAFQAHSENEQLRRMVQLLQGHNVSIRVTLYALLTQKGGSIESAFTKGTLEQVQQNLARLSVEVNPLKDDPETYSVQLVEAPMPQQEDTREPNGLHNRGTTEPIATPVAD